MNNKIFLLLLIFILCLSGCNDTRNFNIVTNCELGEFILKDDNLNQVGRIIIQSKSTKNMICSILDNNSRLVYENLVFDINTIEYENFYTCKIDDEHYYFICKATPELARKYCKKFKQKKSEVYRIYNNKTGVIIYNSEDCLFTDYSNENYYFFQNEHVLNEFLLPPNCNLLD